MRKELDEKLVKAFPLLYADRRANPKSTCMCWGFECGDGWFDLLWAASQKLEALIKKSIEDYPEDDPPRAFQVKEKYGTLRFYLDNQTTEMLEVIEKAEEASETTCEECGKTGELYGYGWVVTLCKTCAEKRDLYLTTEEFLKKQGD